MFVGIPAPQPHAILANGSMVVPALMEQAQVRVATSEAHVLPFGRASALMALEAGLRCLEEGRADWVIVGGMDSHLDLGRLGALDAEQRLLGSGVMDGFIPGEGAGFALLTHERTARQHGHVPRVRVLAASSVIDPGHRYGTEPAKGEGLSNALTLLFQQVPEPGKIQQTYAGLNGESFGAKEWGVSRIRHAARFAEDSGIEHPADCHGDVGAATGAILLGLAERALGRGDQSGPVLIWCSSDREHCGAALLDLHLRSQ
jgi:3-oxoacyl-[acyl-carrier-protein] synthase-1